MDKLYLFEAGATKTALVYQENGERQEVILPAFNPNRNKEEFIEAMRESVEIADDARVFFYGSGLSLQSNKDLVASLFTSYSLKILDIYDDIVGAARAAFKHSPGIICIMGTGGLAAYYNGRSIKKRRGGYGYLIDDLGGGFELGRRIISSWLNGDFSEELDKRIQQKLEMDKNEIIYEIYQNGRVSLISEIVKLIPKDIEDKKLNEILDIYFKNFIQENVIPLRDEYNISNFSIVGGIGTVHYRRIGKIAKSFDLKVDQCIQSPVRRLFDFHSNY